MTEDAVSMSDNTNQPNKTMAVLAIWAWTIPMVMLFLSGCAALIRAAQEPFQASPGPPVVIFGGYSGDMPWARVANSLNVGVVVNVDCPGRMTFDLPPKTSQRFFFSTFTLPGERFECRVFSWEVKNLVEIIQ